METSPTFEQLSTFDAAQYLKVRAYLYKFSPDFTKLGKGKVRPDMQSDAIKAATANYNAIRTVANKAQTLRVNIATLSKELKNIQRALNDLVLPYSPIHIEPLIERLDVVYRTFLSWNDVAGTKYLVITTENISSITIKKTPVQGQPGVLTYSPLTNDWTALVDNIKYSVSYWVGSGKGRFDKFTEATITHLLYFLDNRAIATLNTLDKELLKSQSSVDAAKAVAAGLAADRSQFKVVKFAHDLHTKDLSRFDISQFVTSYNTRQDLSSGTINWVVSLQDVIIPMNQLRMDTPNAIRRPIFFPDEKGNYAEEVSSGPVGPEGPSQGTFVGPVQEYTPTVPTAPISPEGRSYRNNDPISGELVSELDPDILIERIATYQSVDDGDHYDRDIDRIELAIRLRGIKDLAVRRGCIDLFRGLSPHESLIKLLESKKIYFEGAPFRAVSILNGVQILQDEFKLDTSEKIRIAFLKSITNPEVDGIALSDLVQKYDVLSIFVYKWPISPTSFEDLLLQMDPDFFDKEANFLYYPLQKVIPEVVDQYFSLYEPEFTGFVKKKSSMEVSGKVNLLNITGEGGLGLFAASRRLFNTTIWQKTIFDAAEAMGDDLFTVFQNLFADLAPNEILELLLEGVYKLKIRDLGKTSTAARILTTQELRKEDVSYNNAAGLLAFLQSIRPLFTQAGLTPNLQNNNLIADTTALVNKIDTLLAYPDLPIETTENRGDNLAGPTPYRPSVVTTKTRELVIFQPPEATPELLFRQLPITVPMSNTVYNKIATLKAYLSDYNNAALSSPSNGVVELLTFVDRAISSIETPATDTTPPQGILVILGKQLQALHEAAAEKEAIEKNLTFYKSRDALLNGPYIRDSSNLDGIEEIAAVFDISDMIFLNQYKNKNGNLNLEGSKLLFNLPMFLYANVMRMRKFNVRVPTKAAYASANFQIHQTTKHQKECDAAGGSTLEMVDFKRTEGFKPYFLFLNSSLGSYIPEMKTPWEIMNDVKTSSYLEFFETPGGRIILRAPQWNETDPYDPNHLMGNMISSIHLNIIRTSYAEDAYNFIAKQHIAGPGVDLIGLVAPFLYYHYTNGKILSQYGLFTDVVQVNPNVRMKPFKKELKSSGLTTTSYLNGIFEYCRFFLEFKNMNRFYGEVQCVGDPSIQVGKTYFDFEKGKFGYITSVVKNLVVGGSYTTSFSLHAVRDAVGSGEPFRKLPYLSDIIEKFGGSVDDKPSTPSTKIAPTKEALVMQSILKQIKPATPGSPAKMISHDPGLGPNGGLPGAWYSK